MPAHNILTGSELHEVKGVDVATVGQILISNGAGSAVWSPNEDDFIGISAFDTTTQTAPSAGVKADIIYDTQIFIQGITHTLGTANFTINSSGIYSLIVIPQFVTGGGGAGIMEVSWDLDTGGGFATIAGSPVRENMAASAESIIQCEIWVNLTAGDIVKAGWATSSASVNLIGSAPLVVGDVIPSVQLYVSHHGI